MPKDEMKKRYGSSPDVCDALMLSFVDDDDIYEQESIIESDYSNYV
jgi:hypothetical protein